MDVVASFPEEVTDMVFSHLQATDLEYCCGVSQLWRRTIERFKQRQRARLKYNWQHGKYSVNCSPISIGLNIQIGLRFKEYEFEVVPVNDPCDQVFPVYMYFKDPGCSGAEVLSIINIDSNSRIKLHQLPRTSSEMSVVIVVGDSIAWLEPSAVLKHYNAELASNGSKVETFGKHDDSRTDEDFEGVEKYKSLTMDRNHIAVVSNDRFVKVWCKKSHKKIITKRCVQPKISLSDGCLIIASYIGERLEKSVKIYCTEIEIHNLQHDANNTLLHTFNLDGIVESTHSKERFIFIVFSLHNHKIQVRDKKNFTVIYSYDYNLSLKNVFDDYIVVKGLTKGEQVFSEFGIPYGWRHDYYYKILTLASGEWSTEIPSRDKNLFTVFENIAVVRSVSDKSLYVLDWKRFTKLYTLRIPEHVSDDFEVINVTEWRIIVFDSESNQFIIFKFG
ncbi:uncharacterized protein LOC111053455 [Nilaparvata lugens]|uniref:uncharacterized protein LOC111053455 n=1 Tax=Nilaparvata lugens TaxID=108931 RepID=UPI00193E2EBD|nr:uncharacterized protein LOC111053455 [Nilaparvata lugens]